MNLTIIIPTRNRHNRVVECVHALEHNEADIVVIDDHSEEPVSLRRSSARIIRLGGRRGRSDCVNTGLKAAKHDLVLIIDDDIYAAPDMVVRLLEEFSARNNPKLCLTPRVTWDPNLSMTLTMKWMESVRKFPAPMLLSKSFIVENGGYDENFTRRLEDTELQLRLKKQGLEMARLESAVGFQSSLFRIRDLVEREFVEGISAVLLHAKFPEFMPQVGDMKMLLKNEGQGSDASAAVDEILLMEQSGPSELPTGIADLYAHVCRHFFLHGVFEGLKDIGGTKPRRDSSSTVAIYRQASHLEEIGEFDEARRLFRLVLHRPDEQYWDRAEYHLGCIEILLGNPEVAHVHFLQCLRLNPAHNKARRALYKPAHYREVESNVFEMIELKSPARVLLILFGDLGDVVSAFPVVPALKKKFNCEMAWLTSPEYAALARSSFSGEVHEAKSRGIIPWDWIYEQGFTHVFFPEPGANYEEWEQSGLHATDFIARKCQVQIESRRPQIEPSPDATAAAKKFLRDHGLRRNAFITATHGDSEGRHWPKSNLVKLAQQSRIPVVVFGKKGDPAIPCTVVCRDKPPEVVALLIRWSCFYLGSACGTSWLATTTDTPIGVFFDPQERNDQNRGCLETRADGKKQDIQEWSIYTNLRTVLDHIESAVCLRQ